MEKTNNINMKAVKLNARIRKLKSLNPVADAEMNPVFQSIEQLAESDNWKDKQTVISSALDRFQTEYGISIGVQLDTDKMRLILDHMIANDLTTVNIKFEIWK